MEWQVKQREYEQKKARAKALKLRLTCSICSEKAKLNCPCGTTQYCSTECQRIDWRDRGHRKACKKIRNERAADAARAEAPTPSPSPPVYGPAPRSHADEVRARIAAEHEAARLRREANPEREPTSARWGSRCPICLEDWDVNVKKYLHLCCCKAVCMQCAKRFRENCLTENRNLPCHLCRAPTIWEPAESLAAIRRHVENGVPEAMAELGAAYVSGRYGLVPSAKKSAKIFKRAVELGDTNAMLGLAGLYDNGTGVKKDHEKAMQLWHMAADRGCASSQFNLGNEYWKNNDFRRAAHYYTLSANQGLALAENCVAGCYETGLGRAKDHEEAMRWYMRAAAKGDEDAEANLARLRAIIGRPSPGPREPYA